MDGLWTCEACGLDVIDEEREAHACRRGETDYKIEGNVLWYFDGFKWSKRTLPKSDESKQRDMTTLFRRRGNRTRCNQVYILSCFYLLDRRSKVE